MTVPQKPSNSTAFIIVGVLFVIWGILGLMDYPNVPYSGYTAQNNTVVRVYPGSPAQQAGLRVGDRIVSVDGIRADDVRAREERGRAAIGSTRTFVVAPAGDAAGAAAASRTLNITFTALPARNVALRYLNFVIGLCFVLCLVGASRRVAGQTGNLLALVGLCLGFLIFDAPYFASSSLRRAAASSELVIGVFGIACLLHLMLQIPRRSVFLDRAHALKAVYGPAAAVAGLVAYAAVFRPPAAISTAVGMLLAVFAVAYLTLTAIALLRSFLKASPEERSESGLNSLLAGILIGVAPLILALLIAPFAPAVTLPGIDFYGLTLILIPIALSAAAKKQAALATAARAKPQAHAAKS
jgi:hypothetical protein